jgi:hypothetical protein
MPRLVTPIISIIRIFQFYYGNKQLAYPLYLFFLNHIGNEISQSLEYLVFNAFYIAILQFYYNVIIKLRIHVQQLFCIAATKSQTTSHIVQSLSLKR